MSKKEKIVCAAVKFYQDYGSEDGVVIVGLDYNHCSDIYYSLTGDEYSDCIEGFMTNLKRFISKYGALEMSGLKNQLRFKDRGYLLPEDLY